MTEEAGMPSPFECQVESRRDVVSVCPVGELDIATVGEVDAQLAEVRQAGFDRLLLDLRETTFIDSSGLRLAVAWHKRSHRERFVFALVQGPDAVRHVFKMTGLIGRLTFLDPE
jgi:anti-anti-sigma factor